jgi:ABC-type Fe3+ transport system substrate-binding protein
MTRIVEPSGSAHNGGGGNLGEQTMRAIVVALLLMTHAVWAAEFDPALVDGARKEGTATWYTGLIVNQAARPLAEAFQARFPGVKLSYARASNTETTLKILNESRAGRTTADIFDVTSGIYSLLDAHVVATYRPRSAENFAPVYKDKDGYWTASNLYFMTICYNTNLIKPADAPTTFEDLASSRWAGKIAWTSELAITGPPGFVGNVLTTMGHEAGMAYLKRIAALKPAALPISPRAVMDQVISGEYAIGLQIYNHHAAISAAVGAPIAWSRFEPLIGLFSLMGILKDAPHPNAARLFVEYVMSDEGQKVLADNDYLPASSTVPPRIAGLRPDAGGFKVDYISPLTARDELPKWTAIYQEIFR